MPIEHVRRILDSYDGKELPQETEAVRLTYGRQSWNLYLSDANRKKLDAVIDQWTKDEPESSASAPASAPKSRRSPAARSSAEDLTAVREWAREHGYEVSDRGRIKAEIWEAYRAAN